MANKLDIKARQYESHAIPSGRGERETFWTWHDIQAAGPNADYERGRYETEERIMKFSLRLLEDDRETRKPEEQ